MLGIVLHSCQFLTVSKDGRNCRLVSSLNLHTFAKFCPSFTNKSCQLAYRLLNILSSVVTVHHLMLRRFHRFTELK